MGAGSTNRRLLTYLRNDQNLNLKWQRRDDRTYFTCRTKKTQVPQEIPPLRGRQNRNISESQKELQMPQERVWGQTNRRESKRNDGEVKHPTHTHTHFYMCAHTDTRMYFLQPADNPTSDVPVAMTLRNNLSTE